MVKKHKKCCDMCKIYKEKGGKKEWQQESIYKNPKKTQKKSVLKKEKSF